MSWRTIIITKRAKLDLKMNHVVVRQIDEVTKVFIDEIALLVVESTAVSLTAALISELVKRKIKVIFCDENRNPVSELQPYYGSHDSSSKIKRQMSWDDDFKQIVWAEIVRDKIQKQLDLLALYEKEEFKMLEGYIQEIEIGDTTNREGHAAKVYFNALFGMHFSRTLDIPINAALNYGYTIILSAFNREIVANGYITQIGLFHDNMFNPFNLASDLMEPFRVLIDYYVLENQPTKFEAEDKHGLIDILNQHVYIDNKEQTVLNAIKIYTKSIFDALDQEDLSCVRFYRNEL